MTKSIKTSDFLAIVVFLIFCMFFLTFICQQEKTIIIRENDCNYNSNCECLKYEYSPSIGQQGILSTCTVCSCSVGLCNPKYLFETSTYSNENMYNTPTTVPTTRYTTIPTTTPTTIKSSNCVDAAFIVYSSTYNADERTLYIIVDNRRSVDLFLEDLYIFYSNNQISTKPINKLLRVGEVIQLNMSDVKEGFTSMKIKTNCPDVFVDFIPTMISQKIITLLGATCSNNVLLIVLRNDGTKTIASSDIKILVNNVDRSTAYSGLFPLNVGSSNAGSNSSTLGGLSGSTNLLITSPSNSVRVTVWC